MQLADRIQLRRDTAANWTAANPVLADGEIGIERDTDQFKVGDGVTTWSVLAYGGIQGPQGATGAAGADSTVAGPTGPTGPAGADGASVASGVTFAPTGNLAATDVQAALAELDAEKQAALISATNIKTVNGLSLLGAGNLAIEGGAGGGAATEFVATGAIAGAGLVVALNANGTVSVVAEIVDETPVTAVVFQGASVDNIVSIYDSVANVVVVAYRVGAATGVAVVGVISGTSISFGAPVTFSASNSLAIAGAYDPVAARVLLAYRNVGNSSFGTAIVGTISGTSISFGAPVAFNAASTAAIAVVYDSAAGKVVLAYSDGGNGSFGTAIVGTILDTSVSFGAPTVFQSAFVSNLSAACDATLGKTVVAYKNDVAIKGVAVIGTVSGTSISFGTPVIFNNANTFSTSVAYDSVAGKVVIVYKDAGNGSFGTAIVGSISGTSIGFGTPVVFNSAATVPAVAYDSVADKVVVAYSDGGNGGFGTAVVGTVSGTVIVFSAPVVFESASIGTVSATYSPQAGRVVFAYPDGGNGSFGTAITFGGAATTTNNAASVGIAQAAALDATPVAVKLPYQIDTNQVGLTAGLNYYVAADGSLTTASANGNVLLGRALSASALLITNWGI